MFKGQENGRHGLSYVCIHSVLVAGVFFFTCSYICPLITPSCSRKCVSSSSLSKLLAKSVVQPSTPLTCSNNNSETKSKCFPCLLFHVSFCLYDKL